LEFLKANYTVWVRGYVLVDSPKLQSAPGKTLNLNAVPASKSSCRPGAELLHQREEVGHAPVLGDLAVAHAHDVDGLELNFASRRRHAQEFSPV
jgi:hypothetical protein